MLVDNNWIYRKYDSAIAARIASDLNIPLLMGEMLAQRGIGSEKEARRFLYGGLQDLSNPFNLGGMQAAVDRINQAIAAGERVIIFGDYDVDGICSIVLLKECLGKLGGEAHYYVPDRFTEGYGLNANAVEKLAEEGYKLLITVDCGITSITEITLAGQLGMDVIVTDHHTPLQELPPATAIINPKLDMDSASRDLAGVGVAFKLAMALSRGVLEEEQIYEWLDLAALATVADLVPLNGDNRILVKYGLNKIQHTNRKGLRALLQEGGLEGKNLETWHIGFVLGPRLNSAGRLYTAGSSIELLLEQQEENALQLAGLLSRMNDERKSIEEQIFEEAIVMAEESADLENERILVLAAEGWHVGVMGIVASRLCARYQRPVVLISWEGTMGKGSARSIGNIDIFAAFSHCSNYLVQFGGHRMAAGLRVTKENFAAFRNEMLKWADQIPLSEMGVKEQSIDAEIEIDEISEDLFQQLQLLQPYGEGNPAPKLVLRGVGIGSAALVGKNKEHFKLQTEIGSIEGIAFNKPQFIELPLDTCYHDLLCELGENEFRGRKRIQLKMSDMKSSFMPDRSQQESDWGRKGRSIIEKSVEEVAGNRPVLFVYPTCRSINRHRAVLETFIRSRVLQPLHGFLAANERKIIEKEFCQGYNRIYMVSRTFLKYFLKRADLPNNLGYIVEVWPRSRNAQAEDYPENCSVEVLNSMPGNLLWQKENWDHKLASHVWIYTNRKKTIARLSNGLNNPIVETGIRDIKQVRALRRRFRQTEAAVLLSDFALADLSMGSKMPDGLFFADVPFSIYEALSVWRQCSATEEMPARVLFEPCDLDSNRKYLQCCCPDVDCIKRIFMQLIRLQQKPINMDISRLESILELNSVELAAILHILGDLGLCQFKKKGSIIEIKLNKPESSILDLSNSAYYMEGLAEKKAFARLEMDIKKFLKW